MRSFLHLKWPWKRIFSSIFSFFFPFLFFFQGKWEQEMETREKWKKLLFILFFHSFCFFSSLFRGRIEENGARRNPFLFLLPFLFLKRNGDKNGNEKAFFFPLFLLFFLLFPPSSFQFFLLFGEGKWRGKRIKEIAPRALIHFCKNKHCFSKPHLPPFGQNRLAFAKDKTA